MSIGIALIFPFAGGAQTLPRQFLRGHVPGVVPRLTPIGRLPGASRLNLAIALPLRNRAGLENLLQQIYDPASPDFRHYLTPEQFAEMFGPTKQDYQAVIAFARVNGLTVSATSPNRLVLDVNAAVADVERVFHVTMRTYRHPTEARTFFAPDVEPSIDFALPILRVNGLDNYSLMRPANLASKPISQMPTTNAMPNSGSAVNGTYAGNDFRAAYLPGVTTNQLSGAGQSVGLVEFDGYYTNDINGYEMSNGIPNIPLVNVLLDGLTTNSVPGGGNTEVALDIDMAIAMAPGLATVIVYEAPNNTAFLTDILNRMATDNVAKQLSSSWTAPFSGTNAGLDGIFLEFAAQGQSYFQASGDSDAYAGAIPSPADDSFITIVGGTILSTTGPGGSWTSEIAWNRNNGTGSGGGISTVYPIPSWQQGIDMTANKGSTTFRNLPDVAMIAENIWLLDNNGTPDAVGGTSAAAPLWAGFIALVNQQATASGRPTVGFINPAIYAIGKGPSYTADFHDITTGNNFNSSSPAQFAATSGYDLATGWGTPGGINLVTALATPDDLGIFPGTGFNALGPVGGPFTVTAQNFSLTNSGGTSLAWSLLGVPSWLNVSSSGGVLTSGGNITVAVNLNSVASNLVAGIYNANTWFTNLATHVAQLRQFVLQVGQPLVQNGGFEAGSFSGWTQSGNFGFTSVVSGGGNSAFIHSGTFGAQLGPVNTPGYLSQTLQTVPGQNYLLSLWLDSPNVGNQPLTPNEFSVSWAGNTLLDQVNIGKIGWTNLQFIVTANNASTVLQLGFRDDPYYLGLDDVSVLPIATANFRTLATANNDFNLTWDSTIGLVYQVQCNTNLASTNWVNLGKIIIATNTSIILSDTNALNASRQKFYRLQLLP
ncbi:MAG TPA: protease pro-enzyme activation domain-containing protein [Verrucomicrobiae bacterium]